MKKLVLIFLMVIPLALVSVSQNCATFEELLVPANGYWNGADGSGKFVSGNMVFYNSYNAAGGYWSGFAYSSKTDRTTPDYSNQYSAITGKGVGNSSVYGVAYDFGNLRITLNQPDSLSGLFVTNSTYAYMTLRDGNAFSKKFGGISGNDPDWFRINCFGISAKGDTTGKVVFYLADFRSANQSGDYIVNTWKWMDLSSLGTVSELKFSLESTDIGEWGMNTPAFFCLDDVNGQMLTSSLVADKGEGVNIYPQPFYEALTIESNHMIEKVVISDIWGKTLAEATPSRTNRFILQGLAGMPSGMYIVVVSGDGFKTSRRIVKK